MKGIFKIRDTKTGKFSTGGNNPKFVDAGRPLKVWTNSGPVRSHINALGQSKASLTYASAEVVQYATDNDGNMTIANRYTIHDFMMGDAYCESKVASDAKPPHGWKFDVPYVPVAAVQTPAAHPFDPSVSHSFSTTVDPYIPVTAVASLVPEPPKQQQTTHVAILLDKSGSMHSYRTEAVAAYNATVEQIRKLADANNKVLVTLVTFGGYVDFSYKAQDVTRLKPLTLNDYCPNSGTPLYESVIKTIDYFESIAGHKDENTSFLTIVLTDGEATDSAYSGYTAPNMVKAMQRVIKTDRYTFGFQVPASHANRFKSITGLTSDTVAAWNTDKGAAGLREATQVTQNAVASYTTARSAGAKKVDKFFVTTDLSKITAKDIHTKLNDISDHVKVYEVPVESRIDEFALAKLKKDYVIGSGYYVLTKKEKVQVGKEIMIMEKGKKAVWAGKAAREFLGLPKDQDAYVIPGNHSNFDIFVQSKSVNRKLPRGSKVIIDTTTKSGMTPTWDHTAVQPKVTA